MMGALKDPRFWAGVVVGYLLVVLLPPPPVTVPIFENWGALFEPV